MAQTESIHIKKEFSVTEEDIEEFASVSGDANPLHLDEEYASDTFFGQRIAHGMLPASYISAALSEIDGVVIYVSQNLDFYTPVHIGDELSVEIEELEQVGDDRFILETDVWNSEGDEVIGGRATVIIKDEK